MKISNEKILASVIVPTYNRRQILGYTLETLTRQSIPKESFEVLVVDDGSQDDTFEVVESFQDRLNIRYFYQDDQGYRLATARNVGIAHATSDLIISLDTDILLATTAVEKHIQTHNEYDEPVAVIGYIYGVENDEQQQATLKSLIRVHDLDATISYLRSNGINLDFRQEIFQKYDFQIENLPAPWTFFWAGHVSFDKRCMEEGEGYFDEAYNQNWGCEDVDFGYRLYKKGIKILVNPRIESIHYPHKKYENHKDAQRINLKKFEQIHDSTEVKMLCDFIRGGTHDIYFNDYLLEHSKQLI